MSCGNYCSNYQDLKNEMQVAECLIHSQTERIFTGHPLGTQVISELSLLYRGIKNTEKNYLNNLILDTDDAKKSIKRV